MIIRWDEEEKVYVYVLDGLSKTEVTENLLVSSDRTFTDTTKNRRLQPNGLIQWVYLDKEKPKINEGIRVAYFLPNEQKIETFYGWYGNDGKFYDSATMIIP